MRKSDGGVIDRDDVATLTQILERTKANLQLSVKEAQSLRSIVKAQEATISELNSEKSQLMYRIQDAQGTIARLEEEMRVLKETKASQSATIERMCLEHAETMTDANSIARGENMRLKALVDRLSAHVSQSQFPRDDGPRPLAWSHISTISNHPIHVLRRVVLADQRREESGLHGILPANSGGSAVAAEDDDLEMLLGTSESTQHHSEDAETWRSICRRFYQVLTDRRRIHHLLSDDVPQDFLIRTRHVMVGEWAAMHAEVLRLQKLLHAMTNFLKFSVLGRSIDGRGAIAPQRGVEVGRGKTDGGGADTALAASIPLATFVDSAKSALRLQGELNRQLDVIESVFGDIVSMCWRVYEKCFSDVDKALCPFLTKGIAAT